MIEILATNITSPLGRTTEENYQSLRAGNSALVRYEGWRGVPESFTASILSDGQMADIALEGYSRFESLAIRSVEESMLHCDIDITSPRTLLILSTTKANVDALDTGGEGDYLAPGATAKKIAQHFAMSSQPVVVCNACISGVTAQTLADRLISAGEYDVAIVCGADVISPFVLAGFLSFKSLSPEACRPFDIERLGLNLGEAAATIIFGQSSEECDAESGRWQLLRSSLNNDAYHVSAPSPVGEGTAEAIRRVMDGVSAEDLGVVCVHGTATMFNDQMESKAIESTGLSNVPISALKGYYGHTLGAAGVVETILTARAADDGIVLSVRGFEEIGVGGKVNISNQERECNKPYFLKIISGFGGCNGALLYGKGCANVQKKVTEAKPTQMHRVKITSESVEVDGNPIATTTTGAALLKELYKEYIGDYAKFYKMDTMSRLAIVATELLLRGESTQERAQEHDIVLFNRSSSIVADMNHLATIRDRENFYPSPSVFLYTLPNIALGEVAIRYQFRGETSLYILDEKREPLMNAITAATIRESYAPMLVTGWIDCRSEDEFEAEIEILTKK